MEKSNVIVIVYNVSSFFTKHFTVNLKMLYRFNYNIQTFILGQYEAHWSV